MVSGLGAQRLRRSWPRLIRYGLCLVMLSACSAALEPVVPTLRPTATPTLEPSITPTRAISPTPSPTRTRIVPATATPGPSPTPLFGPAPTRQRFTPTPTQQVVVPGTLSIVYFTTDATIVRPGDTVTLLWSVRGTETAVIYRLDAEGTRGESWNIARAGSLQVRVLPQEREAARFLLMAGDATGQVEQSLRIPINCPEGWFFESQPGGCPPSPPVDTTMAQQSFERGLMLWLEAQRRIYVLFNDGKTPKWAVYADEFQEGQPDRDPARPPPEGLLQPIRGFGLVWRTYPEVEERLGWATTPEIAFDGTFQGDGTLSGGVMYIREKDGNIIELVDAGASWQFVVPGE